MKNIYDLVIIGGGPAGITAGIYAARKKINTLLLSKDFVGQTGKALLVENYPGFEQIEGAELAAVLKRHLEKFKIEIDEESVIGLKKNKDFFEIKTKNLEYSAKSVIITSGAKPKFLGVPGEKEFVGRGVSYCTICDAPFFKEKTVAVAGSGNSGIEASLELTKYAKKVYILEFSSKLKADEVNQEKIKKNNKIEIILSAQIKEIKGENFVKSVIYQDQNNKKLREIFLDGVFIQIGWEPAADFAKGLVNFNEKKEIEINLLTNETKTPGLFAAGDVTCILFKQMIIAAGEGAKAALSCYDYLKK
ncbi:MAG: FAD-dependent oxidoreductase [Candidatus Nealsonbacteria bacterium]|nr:FAD-dependent oxidoreductase [Candidatus Nealsonbacteria bacterium]